MNPRTAITLAALAALAACARPAVSTHDTQNPKITYDVLFTRGGCEIGRFIDYGRPVYITICPGTGLSASQSSYVESCGKNCWHTVERHQRQLRGELPGAAAPPRESTDPAPAR